MSLTFDLVAASEVGRYTFAVSFRVNAPNEDEARRLLAEAIGVGGHYALADEDAFATTCLNSRMDYSHDLFCIAMDGLLAADAWSADLAEVE